MKYLLSLFSVVRGYNILMICLAQYLSAIFILSKKPFKEVILDGNLFALVLSTALAVAGGYIVNAFYDKEKDLINPADLLFSLEFSLNNGCQLCFLSGGVVLLHLYFYDVVLLS